MLTMILLALGSALVMAGYSAVKIDSWKERGFDSRPIRWNLIIGIAALAGVGMGMLSYLGSENPYVSATIVIGGYLMVFSSVIDIMLLKIPTEPTRVASLLGALLFLCCIPSLVMENYLSLAAWGIIILIFGVCSLTGALGDADMKIFIAFFFLFAWWMPPMDIVAAIFLMMVMGLVTRGLASILNIGVKKNLSDQSRWNPETGKLEPYNANKIDTLKTRKERRLAKGKKRTFFPFGPSILVSFVGVAIYSSFNSILVADIQWPF